MIASVGGLESNPRPRPKPGNRERGFFADPNGVYEGRGRGRGTILLSACLLLSSARFLLGFNIPGGLSGKATASDRSIFTCFSAAFIDRFRFGGLEENLVLGDCSWLVLLALATDVGVDVLPERGRLGFLCGLPLRPTYFKCLSRFLLVDGTCTDPKVPSVFRSATLPTAVLGSPPAADVVTATLALVG